MKYLGFRAYFFVLFLLGLSSHLGFSAPLNWDKANREPIRGKILECAVYLSPADPVVNDSVGIRFSGNDPEEFKAALATVLSDKGKEAVAGGHFFILGVPMGQEEAAREKYHAALQSLGLSENDVKIRVMSVPTQKVNWLSRQALPALLQRVKYFFPSRALDYEKPISAEVITGIVSSVAVDIPNVMYLFHALPTMDAALTVTSHAVVLTMYAVYKKFMINWLLRPGSNHAEVFIKQCLMSLPFVVNYNVFGNFSKIQEFYLQNGWDATLARFPHEIAHFSTTQGLTLLLQTMFYNVVITAGFRGWENRQVGEENNRIARSLSNVLATPILAIDAIVLAMASSTGKALVSLGPIDVNTGHAALVGLTVVGSGLLLRPQILDPSIRWYNKMTQSQWYARVTAAKERLAGWLKRSKDPSSP